MKIGSIVQGGRPEGVIEAGDGRLILLKDLGLGISSVRELITAGEAAWEAARAAAAKPGLPSLDSAKVEWAPPIPDPSKILCIALNNSAADYQLTYRPDFPVYFPKLPSALNGHGQPVEVFEHHRPCASRTRTFGVIIGKTARYVSREDAMDHVFGYAIFNDITGVGMRKEDNFIAEYPLASAGWNSFKDVTEHIAYQGRYKSADGFAPMGPLIVHKSLVPDPMNLRVRCWLDDEEIMNDSTSGYHFSIPEVIYWISAHATLFPGDIIALGTALHPDINRRPISYGNINKFGDRIRIEIEGLGTLETPVRRRRDKEDPRTHFHATKNFGGKRS